MDDWSEIRTNLQVKQDCVRLLFSAIDSCNGLNEMFVKDLRVDGEDKLFFDDPFGEWEGHREFASILAPYVQKGYLRSVGEGNGQWGYYFDGCGAVFPIRFQERIDFRTPVIMSIKNRKCVKSN